MSATHPKRQKAKLRRQRRAKIGTAPGTIVTDPNAQATKIRAFGYSTDAFQEYTIEQVKDLAPLLSKWPHLWIDVAGLGTSSMIIQLGELLKLHPLSLEDTVNVHQRSKADPFQEHLYMVARMCNPGDEHITEQISFFIQSRVVVTVQERIGDSWDVIRERLRVGGGNIRSLGVDYLAYLLLDAVVDSYFSAVDTIGDQLDNYDEQLCMNHGPIQYLHDIRHQLLSLRRAIRPHRDMINELIRDENPFISLKTRVFLRDCFDHVIQLLDLVDTYRELSADLREYQMTLISNRMNEVMKVLTIISTIFIPLTFIAGVYGMNFDHMPELRWTMAYPITLAVMFIIALGMVGYFRRRNWF